MSRQGLEFPAKIKVQAFERCKGRCENCGARIAYGAEYDHRIPVALGGPPTLDNCRVLCKTCHGLKTTKDDVPTIAKSKRVRQKHVTTKEPSKRGFRGWRKMNGEIVWKK